MSAVTFTFDRGRLLADLRPRLTPFGLLFQWTLEDLDAEGDDTTMVASGLASAPGIAILEFNTAALADVRSRNHPAGE